MGAPPVAQLRHINKIYGAGDTEVRAVNDLSLTVEAGDYLAVMGASGSGKSTAMNILGCLDRPSSGSYLLQGQPVEGLGDDDSSLAQPLSWFVLSSSAGYPQPRER